VLGDGECPALHLSVPDSGEIQLVKRISRVEKVQVRMCRLIEEPILPTEANGKEAALQSRVKPWMLACFGAEISANVIERNHRFMEEALELMQSTGCTKADVLTLVDYVYGRPVGDQSQEVGGVMVTLAALCLAAGLDMHDCGDAELARIWEKIDKIRAKRATKNNRFSPLPTDAAEAAVQP
jgi:hypothetical protein